MTVRYVVLHHTGVPDPHYDFMIESKPGGPLYTWRCPQNPLQTCVLLARRIRNHRPAYLDYEGEVSGGRGRVARVASGRCTFEPEVRRWVFTAVAADVANVRASYWMAPVTFRHLRGGPSPRPSRLRRLFRRIFGLGRQRAKGKRTPWVIQGKVDLPVTAP